jgi:hypothetical protein
MFYIRVYLNVLEALLSVSFAVYLDLGQKWSKENKQKDNGQQNNTQKTLRLRNMKPTLKQG